MKYQLQQLGHNNQVFVPLHSDDSACFVIQSRSSSASWFSKPDIVIKRLRTGEAQEKIGSIRFDRTLNELPWISRASIAYALGPEQTMEMDKPTSLRWAVNIDEGRCYWSLKYSPASLVLTPADSSRILALFSYGERGNQAHAGQTIGELQIMENHTREEYTRQILCTLCGVLVHWKRAGKILMTGRAGAGAGA